MNTFTIPANPVRRGETDCIFVRENATGFDLVRQCISFVGDDFTIDERVLTSGPTPQAVLDWFHTAPMPTTRIR